MPKGCQGETDDPMGGRNNFFNLFTASTPKQAPWGERAAPGQAGSSIPLARVSPPSPPARSQGLPTISWPYTMGILWRPAWSHSCIPTSTGWRSKFSHQIDPALNNQQRPLLYGSNL